MAEDRPILWTPGAERAAATRMARYIAWLEENRGLQFDDYQQLWDWSVRDLDGFWTSIVEFCDLPISGWREVLPERKMPGADWFPGAETNLAAPLLRFAEERPEAPALVCQSETFGRVELTWRELADRVGALQASLKEMGVGQGDRVVAVLPNTPDAIIAIYATVGLGAIWSLCSPDMGFSAILDRFRQIEPKVLIAQDGYVHAGRTQDKRAVLDDLAAGLPSLEHKIIVPVVGDGAGWSDWGEMLSRRQAPEARMVPFSHPLWVVYSSGTTGNPKPIVHGHGGVMVEGAKQALHQDTGPDDRFCWLTSSGWIMWNTQVNSLNQGAMVALHDGAANHPDMLEVWRMVAREKLTYFGAGAAFYQACLKAGARPGAELDLSSLRALGSTGSPLSQEGYDWIYSEVKSDVWLAPISGGTDFAGAFVLGNPMMPVRAGEMQCRALGNAVRSFDEEGRELTGEVGELVCTEPLPSMPLFFWGDEDGSRLHDSYFDTYPGVWRHGDWIEITEEGGAVIYGRSDATINRRGLRLGSSEIYRAVEALDEVLDSLVIDLEFLGRESFMVLFVVPKQGPLDSALRDRINLSIRNGVSARFLPDEIVEITDVPRTLSGKKLEVPVKKLLLGHDPEKVVNRDSMANPESFDQFITYAEGRRDLAT
ncbi:acetoacetyl-CoA synthase [Pseudooceanicola batsensis HTCC2597]|uniref:Acetoacetyl-CoA synthase n=1 Tax=Pseudooceanicola batsensis (strain ATCC BAA-863 / DSM 15984 / KCTC 12145 / HTCC2597) TaxID=252305 RepID=A3TTK2_PSEBH|nr:acetoacetate--CoA ligase [Pseudooceanicola batsensis]EAQ04979.1 acetoacetyl-CoA synthase [Pseudooceanicola batsensis HTCC2597]